MDTRRRWHVTAAMAAGLALLAAGAARTDEAAEGEEAKAPELETRAYHVGYLIAGRRIEQPEPQDFDLGYAGKGQELGDLFAAPSYLVEDEAAFYELIDFVQRYVNNSVDPEVAPWTDEGGRAEIRLFGDGLMITQTKAGHRRVEEVLRLAGELSGWANQLRLQFEWVSAPVGDTPAAWKGEAADSDATLAALRKAKGQTVARAEIRCRSTQEVHWSSSRAQAYVWAVEPAGGSDEAVGYAPRIASVPTGVELDATPRLTDDGRLALRFLTRVTRLEAMEYRKFKPAPGGGDGMEVGVPTAGEAEFGSDLILPFGKPTVVGAVNVTWGEAPTVVYLVATVEKL